MVLAESSPSLQLQHKVMNQDLQKASHLAVALLPSLFLGVEA